MSHSNQGRFVKLSRVYVWFFCSIACCSSYLSEGSEIHSLFPTKLGVMHDFQFVPCHFKISLISNQIKFFNNSILCNPMSPSSSKQTSVTPLAKNIIDEWCLTTAIYFCLLLRQGRGKTKVEIYNSISDLFHGRESTPSHIKILAKFIVFLQSIIWYIVDAPIYW